MVYGVFFINQKTAFWLCISYWSSVVCSSDLLATRPVDLNFLFEVFKVEHRFVNNPGILFPEVKSSDCDQEAGIITHTIPWISDIFHHVEARQAEFKPPVGKNPETWLYRNQVFEWCIRIK